MNINESTCVFPDEVLQYILLPYLSFAEQWALREWFPIVRKKLECRKLCSRLMALDVEWALCNKLGSTFWKESIKPALIHSHGVVAGSFTYQAVAQISFEPSDIDMFVPVSDEMENVWVNNRHIGLYNPFVQIESATRIFPIIPKDHLLDKEAVLRMFPKHSSSFVKSCPYLYNNRGCFSYNPGDLYAMSTFVEMTLHRHNCIHTANRNAHSYPKVPNFRRVRTFHFLPHPTPEQQMAVYISKKMHEQSQVDYGSGCTKIDVIQVRVPHCEENMSATYMASFIQNGSDLECCKLVYDPSTDMVIFEGDLERIMKGVSAYTPQPHDNFFMSQQEEETEERTIVRLQKYQDRGIRIVCIDSIHT